MIWKRIILPLFRHMDAEDAHHLYLFYLRWAPIWVSDVLCWEPANAAYPLISALDLRKARP